VIKKEIAYHSDVLNTAARIQGQCNPMGKTLLISERLKDSIQPLARIAVPTRGYRQPER
jgi:adenylate cyclase